MWNVSGKTDSESDDDDENDDYSEEEEDLLEEEDYHWWDDWKQHLLAILAAVVATVVAHSYHSSSSSYNTAATFSYETLSPLAPSYSKMHSPNAPTHPRTGDKRHPHVHSYKRMANLTFCLLPSSTHEKNIDTKNDESYFHNSSEALNVPRDVTTTHHASFSHGHKDDTTKTLLRFDFLLSKDFAYVLERYYLADVSEEDGLTTNQPTTATKTSPQLQDIPEYQCLRQQANKDEKRIRGYAYAYQQPSLSDMLRNHPEQDTATKTARKLPSVLHDNKPIDMKKGEKTTLAEPVSLSFTGFAAKFVNMGPTPVLLHWDGSHRQKSRVVAEIPPFQAVGTATTPGQSFRVSPLHDTQHALQRWTVTADEAVLYYHENDGRDVPFTKKNEQLFYNMQRLNQKYAKHYLVQTGRTWLAHFPRPLPLHPMRSADYFGQRHELVTRAVHYHSKEEEDPSETLHLTMEAVSVAPRVFRIDDFLSKTECQYLMETARQQGLELSTVMTGSTSHTAQRDTQTRSSSNAWIPRETSNITDTIYRRAANVLQMDEALFRHRSEEHMDIATHHAIAESLQILRYQEGQEYTAHYDWIHPSTTNRYQPTRFATLLLYLNDEDLEGGETVFPRAVNDKFHDGITIRPTQGMAVLFYNMLPDGNFDDLSSHASKPVTRGEKWLANLWVWDPIID